MKITGLVRGKKSARINVFVDEEFSFSVEEITLTKFNLYKGKELTEQEIEEISSQDLTQKFLFKAVDYLGRRPRSTKEIKDYLNKKLSDKRYFDIDKEKIYSTIGAVVKKLAEKNYLNDLEFARWWIRSREEHRPRGKQVLKQELFQKGIDKETVEEVLKDGITDETQFKSAEKIALKKLELLKNRGFEGYELKNKLSQYVLSKGYSWDIVSKIVKEIL
jgi:regulatory protein